MRNRLDALWNDQFGKVESDSAVRNGCRIVGLQARIGQMELVAARTGIQPQPIQFAQEGPKLAPAKKESSPDLRALLELMLEQLAEKAAR